MYTLILNFTYPLRRLRVPPVEYHWSRPRNLKKFLALFYSGRSRRSFFIGIVMKHLFDSHTEFSTACA
jgi:hypothetical protein